jgi:phage tail tape-measure protein
VVCSRKEIAVSASQQEEHERVGGIAGLGAGVIAGAQIGTAFIPVPIVGTFAGALIGGVLGSEIGKTVGAALLDGVHAFTESLSGARPSESASEPPVDPNAP